MYDTIGYAQPLRAIGQALETLNIQNFEMEPAGDAFLVRGAKAAGNGDSHGERVSSDKLRSIWGNVVGMSVAVTTGRGAKRETSASSVELHYTAKDIERLEQEGRSRRVDPHRTADATCLSQLLRCIGAYLNQKRARLVRVSRDDNVLSVEYETSLGSPMKENLGVPDLYDLWVRMYLQRASRNS
jgi:hypothetical protein